MVFFPGLKRGSVVCSLTGNTSHIRLISGKGLGSCSTLGLVLSGIRHDGELFVPDPETSAFSAWAWTPRKRGEQASSDHEAVPEEIFRAEVEIQVYLDQVPVVVVVLAEDFFALDGALDIVAGVHFAGFKQSRPRT